LEEFTLLNLKKTMMNSNTAARGARQYVFRSWKKRLAARLFDIIGMLCIRFLTLGRGLKPDSKYVENPKNILVVRLDHIGDVLFARPAFATLRQVYPHARITALVSSAGSALLAREPYIDEILIWDAPWFARTNSQSGSPGFWQMVKKIRKRQFDLSLDLRGDLRHHVLLSLAGVSVRLGYGITGGAFLLHIPLYLRVRTHEVERNLDAVQALKSCEIPRKYLPLILDDTELQAGEKIWQSQGQRVVVHPAAGDPKKQWSTAYFAQVCDYLANVGCEIVLVGTAAEKRLVQQVADCCSQTVRILAGTTTLRELVALITAADLFIGNDSGPAHIAVTQGKPVIMIWSETNTPEEWGPWGEGVRAQVIRYPWREDAVPEVIAAAQAFLQHKTV